MHEQKGPLRWSALLCSLSSEHYEHIVSP